METLLLIPVVPVVIGIVVGLFNKRSTRYQRSQMLNIIEFGVLIFLVSIVGIFGWFMFRDSQMKSMEFLNGEIAAKDFSDISCRHCHTVCDSRDDDGNCTSSHEECDHSYDRIWWAETNYNFDGYGHIEFPTTDRQGLNQPERWTAVVIGESATSLHPFTSYLKPSGESDSFPIPLDMKELYGDLVPVHSTELAYDYYHAIKVQAVGFETPPPGFSMAIVNNHEVMTNLVLNSQVEDTNQPIGPEKQGNLQIFYVNAQTIPDNRFADLSLGTWRGGGKNDITIWIGINNWPEISWARVTLGATEIGNELFVIQLRDAIRNMETVENLSEILKVAEAQVFKNFDRKQMAEFADRKPGIHPTSGQLTALYIIVVVISIGGSLYFYSNDPFEVE